MNTTNLIERLAQIVILIDGAYSPDTIRAYRTDFYHFIEFCEARGEVALPGPPEAVADFIQLLMSQGKRSASIRRAVAGIASIHNLTEHLDPTKQVEVRLALRRMHRQIGRYSRQAQAINKHMLDSLLGAADQSLRGTRDRALLLVAYDTMCRRSELVSMRVEDIKVYCPDNQAGVQSTAILLRRSKTDKEAHGKWLRISKAAAKALFEWLSGSGIQEGLIFRGVMRGDHLTEKLVPGQISRIFKRIARLGNFEESVVQHISGHSTRVGAAQDLVLSGASLPLIMHRGRWSKSDTVMRYVENLGIPL